MVFESTLRIDYKKSYTDSEIEDNEIILKMHIPFEIS